jgi:hypothetical protein
MVHTLLAMYEKGAITADHLATRCLEIIDSKDPSSVLDVLPKRLLSRVLDYAIKYQSGPMIANHGGAPTVDQVEAARRWIEETSKMESASSSKA